jgi:hypothetical protein
MSERETPRLGWRTAEEPRMKQSELPCGSGAAWIDDKVVHFRFQVEIRRGTYRGWFKVVVYTPGGALRMRKVPPENIIYLAQPDARPVRRRRRS